MRNPFGGEGPGAGGPSLDAVLSALFGGAPPTHSLCDEALARAADSDQPGKRIVLTIGGVPAYEIRARGPCLVHGLVTPPDMRTPGLLDDLPFFPMGELTSLGEQLHSSLRRDLCAYASILKGLVYAALRAGVETIELDDNGKMA